MILPIKFCHATIENGPYFVDNFFRLIEYAMAANTAKSKKSIPHILFPSVPLLIPSMTKTPKKEIKSPIMFKKVSFSFRNKKAATGVNTGMVEIITALITGLVYFIPKVSPKK